MSEDVEDRVAQLAETVADHGETLGNLSSVTVELAGEVESLRIVQERLLEAQDQEQGQDGSSSSAGRGDGGLRPWTRSRLRGPECWDQLVLWVDEMCSAHAVTVIPRCWFAHEGLVLELEALRSGWVAAMARHEDKPSRDLADWYTYLWWPFLARVEEGFGRCRHEHQPDPAAMVTDRTFLPTPPASDSKTSEVSAASAGGSASAAVSASADSSASGSSVGS